MSVGENIRRYRKSRGMTQAQLAEAVGLTEGAVRHYESGICAVKPELLESIAAALGVSVNALKDYGVVIGLEQTEDIGRETGRELEGAHAAVELGVETCLLYTSRCV